MDTSTVPSPRLASSFYSTATTTTSPTAASSLARSPSASSHGRRPSIPILPETLQQSPRAVPVPVPQRHGSIYSRTSVDFGPASPRRHARGSGGGGGSLSGSLIFGGSMPRHEVADEHVRAGSLGRSASLSSRLENVPKVVLEESDAWLDDSLREVLEGKDEEVKVVDAKVDMEQAVDTLLKSTSPCLLVQKASGWAFFDYADLNTFLLLVLQASSTTPQVSRSPSKSTVTKPAIVRQAPSDAEYAIDDEQEGMGYLDPRSMQIVKRLRRNEKVCVGDVCDISQKDPFHAFAHTATLRTILPLFASGLHRIAVTVPDSPKLGVLSDSTLIEHLLSLPSDRLPACLHEPVSSPALGLALNPLISLPGTASVLDAMQVMSVQGLTVLGVLTGPGSGSTRQVRRESSSSSNSSTSSTQPGRPAKSPSMRPITASPSLIPALSPSIELSNPMDASSPGDLLSVVTAQECTAVVVPSEGKQILGMGLEKMVKGIQLVEQHGREHGEERVPVHTITGTTTLLRACHLLLATSSSRVFVRQSTWSAPLSPPLSPTPSLSLSASSPPPSPSVSSLNLSELSIHAYARHAPSGLPAPPPIQLSRHQVISTLDILAALARRCSKLSTPSPLQLGQTSTGRPDEMPTTWDLDPSGMAKRRRASSTVSSDGSASGLGFESWRWAKSTSKG